MRPATVEFRPLVAEDLARVHDWLAAEHVRRWWGERGSLRRTVEHYLPAIEGREPTDLYMILVAGQPAGMIQTYLVADHPDHAALAGLGTDDEVAGIDLFLGESRLTGKGLGAEVIRRFTADVVFARTTTRACVADPDADNVASIRAFEKAGYVRVRKYHDPADGRPHVLMRRER